MIDLAVDSDHKFAEMLKALGHPARLAIVKFLAENNQCVCGNISDELPLAKSTVSQHLKKLKEANLIKGTIDGQNTCYCLNKEGFEEFGIFLNELKQIIPVL